MFAARTLSAPTALAASGAGALRTGRAGPAFG